MVETISEAQKRGENAILDCQNGVLKQSPVSLAELIKPPQQFVNTLIKSGVESIPPILVIAFEDAKQQVIDLPDLAENRELLFYTIGAKLLSQKKKPAAAYFVSEAWVSALASMEELKDFKILPRHDPMRKAAIMIYGMTKDGDALIAHLMVKHNRRGLIVPVEEWLSLIKCRPSNLLEAFFKPFQK
jgi:hypothetical protein